MTPSVDELNDQYTEVLIPLELIDEPENPERELMEETDLADLALNIREVGLIHRLIVKSIGARFETVVGHRRLLACRLVGYSPVPCRLKSDGAIDYLAILIAENHHREDVNPVEEARFYDRVLNEKAHNDVDELCIILRRKRGHVEDRLNLLRGFPEVIEALHQKRITISVARELNKCSDPKRLLILLDTSIQMGATARQVAEWRKQGDMMGPIGEAENIDDGTSVNGAAIAPTWRMECLFCSSSEDLHMMEMFYVHKPCRRILERMIGRPPADENGANA